jgi:hypothetical protein
MPNNSTRKPIHLLAGMPRAGTGWCFEILTALTVADGGIDARELRKKYKLQKYLTAGNAVVKLRLPDLLAILYPWFCGEKYAIKTHESPNTYQYRIISRLLLKSLLAAKVFIPIFIYREPRDAVLSAYEYGKRQPETRGGAYFAKHVPTIEAGIVWMKKYLTHNWDAWVPYQNILTIRYEEMIADHELYIHRMIEYLGLNLSNEATAVIVENFRRGGNLRGTHFHKGVAGRFRESFSPEQQKLADQAFGAYLDKMGYER